MIGCDHKFKTCKKCRTTYCKRCEHCKCRWGRIRKYPA